MLTVVGKKNKVVTIDSLWRRAKDLGMCVDIDDDTWCYDKKITVTLRYESPQGSNFHFRGRSCDDVIEAFCNAFNEAKIIGMNYDS